MLQPMDPDIYQERSKHKFMVQSAYVRHEDESSSFDEIWSNASSEQIMDSKLKCTFMDADANSKNDQQMEQGADTIAMKKSPTSATTGKQVISSQYQNSGDGMPQQIKRPNETVTTSTPVTSRGSTSAAGAFTDSEQTQQGAVRYSAYSPKRPEAQMDHSMLSHNLSNSFHQNLSEDKKIMLVSLVMLILGVILGKYII